jgi:group I intron endonuclease
MSLPGIYCIENLINGRKYIGQGKDVEKRMNRNMSNENIYLDEDINEYGKNKFKKYIIIYCDKNMLDFWEDYFIINLHSHISEGGYNIFWGGKDGAKGTHRPIVSDKDNKYKHKKDIEIMKFIRSHCQTEYSKSDIRNIRKTNIIPLKNVTSEWMAFSCECTSCKDKNGNSTKFFANIPPKEIGIVSCPNCDSFNIKVIYPNLTNIPY